MTDSEKTYPTVDGAPLNPYDLPGQPRKDDAAPDAGPTADESAAVPGPGGDPVEPTTADTDGDAAAKPKKSDKA